MRYNGFGKVTLGLLFVFLNVTINGFDIVPDCIGYILILAGLISLAVHHRAFSGAAGFALVLLAFSVIDLFLPLNGFLTVVTEEPPDLPLWLYTLAGTACSIGLRVKLGKGMRDLLTRFGLTQAATGTRLCVALNIAVLVINAALTSPFLVFLVNAPAAIALVASGLAGGIWLMACVRGNGRLLESAARATHPDDRDADIDA